MRDDIMKIWKRTKLWLTFKLLNIVRERMEEVIGEYTDEEMERALRETLEEFYEKRDLSDSEIHTINEFIDFSKEALVPILLERLEAYLSKKR